MGQVFSKKKRTSKRLKPGYVLVLVEPTYQTENIPMEETLILNLGARDSSDSEKSPIFSDSSESLHEKPNQSSTTSVKDMFIKSRTPQLVYNNYNSSKRLQQMPKKLSPKKPVVSEVELASVSLTDKDSRKLSLLKFHQEKQLEEKLTKPKSCLECMESKVETLNEWPKRNDNKLQEQPLVRKLSLSPEENLVKPKTSSKLLENVSERSLQPKIIQQQNKSQKLLESKVEILNEWPKKLSEEPKKSACECPNEPQELADTTTHQETQEDKLTNPGSYLENVSEEPLQAEISTAPSKLSKSKSETLEEQPNKRPCLCAEAETQFPEPEPSNPELLKNAAQEDILEEAPEEVFISNKETQSLLHSTPEELQLQEPKLTKHPCACDEVQVQETCSCRKSQAKLQKQTSQHSEKELIIESEFPEEHSNELLLKITENPSEVQVPSNQPCCCGQGKLEDPSSKLVFLLETKYNKKFCTINELMLKSPKEVISVMINGELPETRSVGTPTDQFDYEAFLKSMKSGV